MIILRRTHTERRRARGHDGLKLLCPPLVALAQAVTAKVAMAPCVDAG